MKKVLLGFVLGILTMIGTSVYANDIVDQAKALIGQQVQGTFPIFIGTSKLKTDVIVVDNRSFMPVRDIAELLNSNVSFIDSSVIVEPKPGTVNSTKLNSLAIGTDEMSQVDKDKIAKWEQERQANLDKSNAEQDALVAQKNKAIEQQKEIDSLVKQVQGFTGDADAILKQKEAEILKPKGINSAMDVDKSSLTQSEKDDLLYQLRKAVYTEMLNQMSKQSTPTPAPTN